MKYLKWLFRYKALKSSASSHQHGGAMAGGQHEPALERETVLFGEIEETVVAENDVEKQAPLTLTAFTGEERMTSLVERPPYDDVCPICFGDFEVPCRAACGHWFCGGCVLQYWNFSAAPPLQPCKCPMCLQHITKLTPQASLVYRREADTREVLKNVDKYNDMFVEGLRGVWLKLRAIPLVCIKRVLRDMLTIDRPLNLINHMRYFALLLGLLYSYSPFDFLRIGGRNMMHIFDLSAIALSAIVYFVLLFFHTRRLMNAENRQANNLLPHQD